MRFDSALTDEAVFELLGKRIAGERLARNLTQEEFARASGVSKRSLERLEAGHGVQLLALVRVLRAFQIVERLDVVLPELGPSPRALAKLKKGRQRGTGRRGKPADPPGTPWRWLTK